MNIHKLPWVEMKTILTLAWEEDWADHAKDTAGDALSCMSPLELGKLDQLYRLNTAIGLARFAADNWLSDLRNAFTAADYHASTKGVS